MRRELQNLTTAIRGLQRDFEHATSKIGDLSGRLSGMESEARQQPRRSSSGSSLASQSPGNVQLQPGFGSTSAINVIGGANSDDEIRAEVAEVGMGAGLAPDRPTTSSSRGSKSPKDRKPQQRPEVETNLAQQQPHYVSRKILEAAMEDLRDDVRNWLDALHQNMISALQQKVDQDNVKEMVQQAASFASDTMALFAKRPITGKCASCDTPFVADPSLLKRTPPVSLERPWPPRGSPGAQVAIRPLQEHTRQVEGKVVTPQGHGSRLPKIMDNKNFPKGRVLRNASQPELRSGRQDAHSPE
mmetsp:Transcript_57175/g.133286  ORF Transcript_57175/g.133286 Transcript_57175/m.133286 type:complete len:301 (-) Transcript_57175:69-971(-)